MRPATEAERALVAEEAHFPITEEDLVFVSDIPEGEDRHHFRYLCIRRDSLPMLREQWGDRWLEELTRRADECQAQDPFGGTAKITLGQKLTR